MPAREAEVRLPIYVLRSEEWRGLWRRSPLAAQVLLVLWGHARTERSRSSAWCSLRRLAMLTGSHRRSIVVVLRLLQERGWIGAVQPRYLGQRRMADRYVLVFPGEAGEAHRQVLERLSRKDAPELRSELVQAGDIFHFNGAWHVRESRVPLSVLSSWAFYDLRRRSPTAMAVYLLVVAYGGLREGLGGTRIARELRIHKARVPGCVRTLRELLFLDVLPQWRGKQRLADRFQLRVVESGPVCMREEEQVGEGDPPEDLLAALEEAQPGRADGLSVPELWEALKEAGLWPRKVPAGALTVGQQAEGLVREFHQVTGAHGEAYVATAAERRLMEGILEGYGEYTWDILRDVLARLRRSGFAPDSLLAVRPYLPDAALRRGLDPGMAQRLARG